MAFDTPAGTRGIRFPARLARLVNAVVDRAVRSGLLRRRDLLLLTTVGRKSGQERTSPLMCFDDHDGGGGWLVVASMGGAPGNPAWYLNLAAAPDRVRVQVGRRVTPVTAAQLHGPERERAWARITSTAPQFAGYERKTDREIPVIRLTPRPIG